MFVSLICLEKLGGLDQKIDETPGTYILHRPAGLLFFMTNYYTLLDVISKYHFNFFPGMRLLPQDVQDVIKQFYIDQEKLAEISVKIEEQMRVGACFVP